MRYEIEFKLQALKDLKRLSLDVSRRVEEKLLPEEDFIRMSELIEDRGLSRILKDAIKTDVNEPTIPFAEIRRQLALTRKAAGRRGNNLSI